MRGHEFPGDATRLTVGGERRVQVRDRPGRQPVQRGRHVLGVAEGAVEVHAAAHVLHHEPPVAVITAALPISVSGSMM